MSLSNDMLTNETSDGVRNQTVGPGYFDVPGNGKPSGGSRDNGDGSAKMFAIGFAVGGTILLVLAIFVLILQSRKTALKNRLRSIRSSKKELTNERASPASSHSTLSRARSSPGRHMHSLEGSPSHKLGYTAVPIDGSPRHNRRNSTLHSHVRDSLTSHAYSNPDLPWPQHGQLRDSLASQNSHTYSNPDLHGQPAIGQDDTSDEHVYNDPNCPSTENEEIYPSYDHLAVPANNYHDDSSDDQLHYAASRVTTDQDSDSDSPYGTTTLERARSLSHLPQARASPAHQKSQLPQAQQTMNHLPFQTHIRSSSVGQSAKLGFTSTLLSRPNGHQQHLSPLRATASLSNLLGHTAHCKTPSLRSLKGLGSSPVHVRNASMIRESSKEGDDTEVKFEESAYYKSSSILPSFLANPVHHPPAALSNAKDSLSIDESSAKLPKVKVEPGYVIVNIRPPPSADRMPQASPRIASEEVKTTDQVIQTVPSTSSSQEISTSTTKETSTSSAQETSIATSSSQDTGGDGRQAVVVNVIHRPLLRFASIEPMAAVNDQAHPLEDIKVLTPMTFSTHAMKTEALARSKSCPVLLREDAKDVESSIKHTDESDVLNRCTHHNMDQSSETKQSLCLSLDTDQTSSPQYQGEHDYWVLESP